MNPPSQGLFPEREVDPYSPSLSRARSSGLNAVVNPFVPKVSGQARFGREQASDVDAQKSGSTFQFLEHLRQATGENKWIPLQPEPGEFSQALKKLAERLAIVDVSRFASTWSQPQATLFGRVESLVGDVAVVSLLHEKTGDLIEAECSVDTLAKEAIGEGDEFVCEVVRDGPTALVRFERLKPNKVTPQRIAEILREVEDLAF